MEQHLQALYLARRLFESAEKAMEAQAMFVLRGDKEDDEIAQQIMATRFDRHFRGYRNTIEQMLGSETLEVLKLDDPKFCKRKPHEITKSLGHLAKVKAINYVPTFRVQSLAQNSQSASEQLVA